MGVSEPVLRLDRVTYRYPGAVGAALDAVSLDVAAGEAVGLLGPNGAGKTTLTRLAMALLHPDDGAVISAGRDTARLAPEQLAGTVGYLFQQPESQLFERTVAAELRFGPAQLGWASERIDGALSGVLERLGLTAWAEAHPYDLPGPARRLVALGAALITTPVLLLLDEPTAGLDRSARTVVQEVVRDETARGTAVVAVTHDPEFAVEALTRAVVLERGRITQDGPMGRVLESGRGGLTLPPSAELARRLELPGGPLHLADAALALAERCRSRQ